MSQLIALKPKSLDLTMLNILKPNALRSILSLAGLLHNAHACISLMVA